MLRDHPVGIFLGIRTSIGVQGFIVFLLSLGSWVKSWRRLYIESYRVSNTLLLETNNDSEGKEQLQLFNQLGAHIQLVSDKSDDDSTGNYGRKTYLIMKKVE